MNAEDYRRAVDAVAFRPDFVPRTLSLLEARRKETVPMKTISRKTALIAAALVALLAVSASAALHFLSPGQVARRVGMDALADLFRSADAVPVEQTRQVGDYQVTLLGLVPGAGLADVADGVEAQKTYAVLACARTDGAPITQDTVDLTVTPLVEGYAPWRVNAWYLNGSVDTFVQDGTLYTLLACDTVEPFADHTVYLAVYPGAHSVPSAQRFSFSADGAIAYQPGQEGALFPLPLDPAKADHEAAERLAGDPAPAEPAEAGETAAPVQVRLLPAP